MGSKETIACFVKETSEGLVLFETGPHSTFDAMKKGLNELGYSLSDVKHVFLTHIHFDHAGAAWAFAELGARVYVHPFGAKHMINPEKLVSSAKRIYKEKMDMLWGQLNPIPESHLEEVPHGKKYQIGDVEIIAWHTPGHAVHHIAWQVGNQLIAGDVAGCKIGLDGMVVPPCPPPDINVEDWKASINLIRGLDINEIYLVHYGMITNIEEHLNELEFILEDWSTWIKPHFEKERSVQEITPEFQAYADEQLKNKGLSKERILQYNLANPAWMSVAGLMRYWKKKMSAT